MAIGRDLALALDPALVMARSGLEPDAWQADVMRCAAPRMMLLCTRQAGKSTVSAAQDTPGWRSRTGSGSPCST